MRRSDTTDIATLPGGLKLVHRRWPGAAVEYSGIIVGVGSRDDGNDPGIAHFVEHTIFKGTFRRSSWHIINRMERVGGELNAYTTKEETVIYTAAPAGNTARAMDLLADLATSSRFPEAELDKEREVVADEINSYLDSPADAVYDDFEELIFAGTPLAHNILGNEEALRRFDSWKCRSFRYNWYTTGNMTLFYCGPSGLDRIASIASRCFEQLPVSEKPTRTNAEFQSVPLFDKTKNIDSHQAHTVMGTVIPGMYSNQRMAFSLFSNILGGPGMNSLLNMSLREKRGLVYSVDSSTSLLTDTGLFTVYFGCDPSDTDRCKQLVRNQIESLAQTPLGAAAMQRARKQYLGQLAVSSDNRESLAIATGRGAMYHNRVLTPRQTADMVNAVSEYDIMQCAAAVSNLSSLTLV